jgi:phosphate:Na+ symporter
MLKRILLPTILLLLGYGFWLSPDFKTLRNCKQIKVAN